MTVSLSVFETRSKQYLAELKAIFITDILLNLL